MNIFRLGLNLGLRNHIYTDDPVAKQWNPPFCKETINSEEMLKCSGKNIADCVESLIGSVFLSNNLHTTLKFISDIQLVPVVEAGLLGYFPDKDLTFQLRDDLDSYGFTLEDSIQDTY